ncbi:SDR family oxidoreductase [bacterium]|nr:SDR family oxidoreductase [bacterium]
MKTAVVTGASQGIGRATSLLLAQNGFEVALVARSKNSLENVAEEISESGGRALIKQCDVRDEGAVQRCFAELRDEWETISLLFNNAGINEQGTLELSLEQFRSLFEVNVFGAFSVLQTAAPWFRQQGAGTIVNLTSIAGQTGFAGVGGYCATKFALRGLSESLHHELEPLGIRVTALSPSWVETPMAAPICPHPAEAQIAPTDIAEAVLYIHNLAPRVSLKELTIGCRADLC